MRKKFKKEDFLPRSILPGFKEGEFHHLSDVDKRGLLVLLARIQESAYRRGVQHGLTSASRYPEQLDARNEDALYYRFELSPDIAPPYHWGGAGRVVGRMSKRRIKNTRLTSMFRLDMEHGYSLAELGLYITETEE